MSNCTGRFTLLASLTLALISPWAVGQTSTTGTITAPATTPTTTSTTTAPVSTQTTTATTPESKLAAQFTDLAGSKENAASLITGLRKGSPITLTSATASPTGATGTTATTTTSAATFTAPTKPMGYGNVRIALSLAKAQLASQGITNPTPQQLQTALVGAPATGTSSTGSTSTQPGILQMRADGMGWGKIANSMGVKLGTVMSGRQTWPAAGTTSGSSGTTTAAGTSGRSSGITTAAGSSVKHSGVTTGMGGGSHSGVTTGLGQGGGMGYGNVSRGVVNASGGQAGSMAGGGGQGNAGGKH